MTKVPEEAARPARPHPGDAYFASVADKLGETYLRYSFTKGTVQETDFLCDLLTLPRGARVLDVGCGPGRHSLELARRGYDVTGVDISARFVDIARESAAEQGLSCSFFRMDARSMPFADEFEAVLSLCQGGFGLMGDEDGKIARSMVTAVKPNGWVVLTAFSGYFEASHPRPGATFDIDRGVVHETSEIKTDVDETEMVELWTSVYTPRELRLLALGVGVVPVHVWSVEPGAYGRNPPATDLPELMLVARRPKSR